jgi:hypothetical protein
MAHTEMHAAQNDTTTPMFEMLDATDDTAIAIRVGNGTRDGFRELWKILAEKSEEHGSVHLYEEAPGWTLGTYLSQLHGIVPDLRYGSTFDIERYAAVGDSVWAKVLYYQWKVTAPIWPVGPDEMRYYDLDDRTRALNWVKKGD